ncbi:MAG: hypothetical protein AAFU70_13040, partial [Planctomycetota bacterium]
MISAITIARRRPSDPRIAAAIDRVSVGAGRGGAGRAARSLGRRDEGAFACFDGGWVFDATTVGRRRWVRDRLGTVGIDAERCGGGCVLAWGAGRGRAWGHAAADRDAA